MFTVTECNDHYHFPRSAHPTPVLCPLLEWGGQVQSTIQPVRRTLHWTSHSVLPCELPCICMFNCPCSVHCVTLFGHCLNPLLAMQSNTTQCWQVYHYVVFSHVYKLAQPYGMPSNYIILTMQFLSSKGRRNWRTSHQLAKAAVTLVQLISTFKLSCL